MECPSFEKQMHITRQLNPINCIKELSFVVESCSKCISPLHYTTISIHEPWTDHAKTFHDPFWSDLIDFSFIASGANYITDTRQRINRHLADKDQWNLVGCPLDRDFSSGYRHLNFKRKARFTSLGEFEEFSLHTSPKSEIDDRRSVRLGQFHISISLANHRSPL